MTEGCSNCTFCRTLTNMPLSPTFHLSPVRAPLRLLRAVVACLLVMGGSLLAPVPARADAPSVTVEHGFLDTDSRAGTWSTAPIDVHVGDQLPLRIQLGDAATPDDVPVVLGCSTATTAAAPRPHAMPVAAGTWTCMHVVAAADANGITVAWQAGAAESVVRSEAPGVTVLQPALDASERLLDLADGLRSEVTVRNTGNADLLVNTVDPHCPDGLQDIADTGRDGMLDRLAAGQSVTLQCTVAPGRFLRADAGTASVSGTDRSGMTTVRTFLVQALPDVHADAVAVADSAASAVNTETADARLLKPRRCTRGLVPLEVAGHNVDSVIFRVDGRVRVRAMYDGGADAWMLRYDVRVVRSIDLRLDGDLQAHASRFGSVAPFGLLLRLRTLKPGNHRLNTTVTFADGTARPALRIASRIRGCVHRNRHHNHRR